MRIHSNTTGRYELLFSPDLSCSQDDFKYLLIKPAEKGHKVTTRHYFGLHNRKFITTNYAITTKFESK